MQESNIVKVQYISDKGELSREYTYFTTIPLNIGDIVTVPVRDTMSKAKVSAIDVPESEIASFKDKVKTIPAGPVQTPLVTEGIELEVAGEPVEITSKLIEEVAPATEPYEKTQALIIVEQNATDITTQAFAIKEITTPEMHEIAEGFLSKIRIELQNLEKKRVEDVKTPNTYIKWVNSKYREGSDLLKRAEAYCFTLIGDYRRKEKAKSDAEQARLNRIAQQALEKRQAEEATARKKEEEARVREEEARRAGDLERAEKERVVALKAVAEAERKMSTIPVAVAPKVETMAKTTATEAGKNMWGTEWDFEIINADLVPREFCMPDRKRIREYGKLYKTRAVMPGVCFFEKDKVSVRRDNKVEDPQEKF